ncbi:helix-turn-helix domain-containing protein [Clostridium zeae]|uniref:helix-turn-helix domain-containing protein n=1 Tax=Clostridium zeae TaxID=2759022 RepID=UPI001A8C14A2
MCNSRITINWKGSVIHEEQNKNIKKRNEYYTDKLAKKLGITRPTLSNIERGVKFLKVN